MEIERGENMEAVQGTTETENAKPARVRSLQAAIDEIKAKDPETILTYDRLLRMAHSGVIPFIKIGRRYFVNMDILTEYLRNGTPQDNNIKRGGLRLIKE